MQDRYLLIRVGTKNILPRLREVSLEVFLLSLSSVSGSELCFFGVQDRNLQIREQRKKIVV